MHTTTMSLSCSFQEAHYCSLESQTNVYGLAKFSLPCGTERLLIASVLGKVMSLEFQKTTPSSRGLQFTYIPGDATIISIDAFNKSYHGNGVVIGVTFSKPNVDPSDMKVCYYLNIYSEWEFGAEFDMNRIVQGCQNVELNFMPFQLWHTELVQGGNSEVVFLLSGGDQRVHLYREDRNLHTFHEAYTEEYFPEFTDLQSNITWMDIQHIWDHTQRLTAIGCQNGLVKVTLVHTATKIVDKSWQIQHDSPITSVQLFCLNTEVDCPSFVAQVLETVDEGLEETQEFNLLVASAIELTTVYRSVLDRGLGDPLVLADSDRCDSVLCSLVADVDFDGQNEVILGTYGQELLVYKFYPKTSYQKSFADDEISEMSNTSNNSSFSNRLHSTLTDGEFRLLWQRSFADPILGLDEVDITGDGVNEVIVVTLQGLHVLQHDLEEVKAVCVERMKAAREQHSHQEDMFTQLLAENFNSENLS